MSCFLPMVRGWELDIHAKSGMPAYVAHGSFDNIIPVDFGRRTKEILTEEGPLELIYRETPIPHTIDPELMPEMVQWVAAVTGAD